MKNEKKIGAMEALQIIYYLMAVDGDVCQNEEEKFDSIVKESLSLEDNSFEEVKAEILELCSEQIDKAIDKDDYYDVIREGVEECLEDINEYEDIEGSLLVWNLLTIAFSDEKYTKEEQKLIKMVVRKFDLDKTVFLEMENSIKAILALDRQEEWLKTTNRSYTAIKDMVDEVSRRKDVIMLSVKELMKD